MIFLELVRWLFSPWQWRAYRYNWDCLKTELSSTCVLRSVICFHLQVLSRQSVRTSGICIKLVVIEVQLHSWNVVILKQVGFIRSNFAYALHGNLHASDQLWGVHSLSNSQISTSKMRYPTLNNKKPSKYLLKLQSLVGMFLFLQFSQA